MHLNSKNGYDLNLCGSPSDKIDIIKSGSILRIHPGNHASIKAKLLVKEGDRVKKSEPIFYDKNHPDVMFTAYHSGMIENIVYGEKRSIISIDIKIDKSDNDELTFNRYKLDEIKKIEKKIIKDTICTSGLWPVIRRRPFSKIADPLIDPTSIFITAFNTAPYAPSLKVIDDVLDFQDLQAGINSLLALTGKAINLVLPFGYESEKFKQLKDISLHTVSGPHPSGNVGYHISKIDPIENSKTQVWYLSMQDLSAIGKLFLSGSVDCHRVIALGGHPLDDCNRHIRVLRGTLVSDIIDSNIDRSKYRIISGDVLSGSIIDLNSSIGFYDEILSFIKNKIDREFMGWLNPGVNKFSMTRTFLSKLFPSKPLSLNTAMNGGVRSIVPIGIIEKMCNLDILPTMLIKSIISKDIEMMEELGIYECDSEDFSLCSYIDASKMNISKIIQDGLDFVEKEG